MAGGKLLTSDGRRVVLLSGGEVRTQQWEVLLMPDGTVSLRNVGGGGYLGYEGEPRADLPVVGRPEPVGWELRAGGEPGGYHVVVPRPGELALGVSELLVYPPRGALRPLMAGDGGQAWVFTLRE
ncbi:hypothetical protein LN042_27985 [Kitasatospora sp. RB6PN24]|uniref:hypothetical protein n=1 Tax=Kitasatospora humi TaxID=2893891 RepID=UPI001E6297E0|nr:hypothetical protein [Kitasatospora humi]MCC9310865.1 hypothetical protein [Kitasatospora humi]